MAAPRRSWDRTSIMYDTLRELDHRTSDRIDVWLLWREHDNPEYAFSWNEDRQAGAASSTDGAAVVTGPSA